MLLRWLASHARPHWRKGLLAIIAVFVVALLEPVLPALMRPLIDDSLIGKIPTAMWQIPALIMLTFLTRGVAEYVANVCSQGLAQQTVADLRIKIFMHEINLSMTEHASAGAGAMLGKITYDTGMISDTISSAWLVIFRDLLILLGLFGLLFYTAWQLTLIVLAVSPIMAYVIHRTSLRIRRANTSLQTLTGQLNSYVTQTLQGLREIKIFGAQSGRTKGFARINQSLLDEQTRIVKSQALNVPLVQIIAAFTVSIVIFFASFLGSRDILTAGEFVSFITALAMTFEPVRRLTNVNSVIQKGLAAAQSLKVLLDSPTELTPHSSQSIVPQNMDKVGDVRFDNVTFAYSKEHLPVLSNFNLHIEDGEAVILRGKSGTGKTSILGLVAGFYLPQQGQVSVGGINTNNWNLSSLRSHMSLVSQHTMLFSGSLRENLCVANSCATDAQLWDALLLAGIDEFVRSFATGLDTSVSEFGGNLSGGQRQRVAIARAFLRDTPILLLDEPTSALDKETEASITDSISLLMRGRTTIVCTHSDSFLRKDFRIVDL